MYLAGKGHEHMGPGTSLVQRTDWTAPQERQMRHGFGCAGRCGGMCGRCGGLGLFDTGLDYTGWGFPEYAIVGLVGYMFLSTMITTKRAARRISGSLSGAYRGAKSGGRNAVGGGRSRRERY